MHARDAGTGPAEAEERGAPPLPAAHAPRRARAGRVTPRAPRALALLACAWAAACGGEKDACQSAVLVTLDTTRADALGCYGAPDDPTPALDALARRALLLERASTTAPLTLPSHCSMMTGLVPLRHTVRDNADRPLPASAVTLAERAREAGFRTAAFLGAVVLAPAFALDQGFDVYDAPEAGPDRPHGDRRADEVIDRALAWLDARDEDERFLLWVHLFDPHTPYEPPAAARRDLAPYAGEVSWMDRQLGRLLERLEAEGLSASTAVLVLGDHGEAFGEHDELTHGLFCYQTTLHVPMLLALPPGDARARPGQRDARLASVVDVQPTLLDALGLEVPEGIDGLSLLAAAPPERGVYFESYTGYLSLGWSPLAGWRDARGKYLHSSRPQLFDVDRDPGEEQDLLPGGAAVRPYQLALADVAHAPRLEESGAQSGSELVRELRGLGYTSVGGRRAALPDPLAPSDRPSPPDKAREHRETLAAVKRLNAGDVAGAQRVLARIAAESPHNLFVLDTLATSLMRQGLFEEALEPLQRLLEERPERAASWADLGRSLAELERPEEAERALRRSLELEPGQATALDALDRLLEAQGRGDEADALRAKAAAGGRPAGR